MKRFVVSLDVLIAVVAALTLGGCFSPAAKQAPSTAVLTCRVLTGQGAGSSFSTDKATAVAQGWDQDTNADVYCDVAP